MPGRESEPKNERTAFNEKQSLAQKKVRLVLKLWNSGRISYNEALTLMEIKTIKNGDVYKITIKK